MYDNCVSVSGTALCTIASVAKEHILIAAAINYQTEAKARNYIEKRLWGYPQQNEWKDD